MSNNLTEHRNLMLFYDKLQVMPFCIRCACVGLHVLVFILATLHKNTINVNQTNLLVGF